MKTLASKPIFPHPAKPMRRLAALRQGVLLAGVFFLPGASIAQAQSDTHPVVKILEVVRIRQSTNCLVARTTESMAKDDSSRQQAKALVTMQCDCIPAEFDKMEAEVKAGTLGPNITSNAFLGRVEPAINVCAGISARASTQAVCMSPDNKEISADKRPAYCACVNEGMEKIDNIALGKDAQDAYADFNARAAARAASRPAPPAKPKGPVALAFEACDAKFKN